jgi:ribosomal protein S1
MLGFIPKGELLNPSDMQKNYQAGSEITASVKDFDKGSRKLILSEKGALKKEEEKDYNAFLSKSDGASGTSLGGLFKDKFSDLQKQVKNND